MQKHGRNASGLAIATNLDPEMVDVFLKRTVEPQGELAWSPSSEKVLLSEQVNLRLAKLRTGGSETVFSASSSVLSNRLLLRRWQYDEKSRTMRATAGRELSFFRESETIERLLQTGSEPAYLVLVTSKGESAQLSTVYYFDAARLDLVSSKTWAKMDAACMRDNELVYVSCDEAMTCSIKGAVEMKEPSTYATLSLKQFASRVTAIETSGKDFLLLGESSQTPGLSVALVVSAGALLVPGIPLAYGQQPRLLKKAEGKQFAAILSNSACLNAAHVNNNNFNKCNFFNE